MHATLISVISYIANMLIDLSNNIIFSQLLPIIMRLTRVKCITSSMQNKQGVRVIVLLETGRPHTLTIN